MVSVSEPSVTLEVETADNLCKSEKFVATYRSIDIDFNRPFTSFRVTFDYVMVSISEVSQQGQIEPTNN
jgi:hypothetical protein